MVYYARSCHLMSMCKPAPDGAPCLLPHGSQQLAANRTPPQACTLLNGPLGHGIEGYLKNHILKSSFGTELVVNTRSTREVELLCFFVSSFKYLYVYVRGWIGGWIARPARPSTVFLETDHRTDRNASDYTSG